MKIIIKEENKLRINKLIDWIIYMVGYTLVFIFLTTFFDSIVIEEKHKYLICFVIVSIVYLLSKTIKPILVKLTIPIIGVTLGLFYLIINLFILKLADWILLSYFDLTNTFIALIFSILLSIVNLVAQSIIEKILKEFKNG